MTVPVNTLATTGVILTLVCVESVTVNIFLINVAVKPGLITLAEKLFVDLLTVRVPLRTTVAVKTLCWLVMVKVWLKGLLLACHRD